MTIRIFSIKGQFGARFNTFLLFVVIFLCLSVHGCYARKVQKDYISSQVGQKVKLGVGSIHGGVSTNEASKLISEFHAISSKPKQIPIKAAGSVSWHVPPKKKHAKIPGFYSDYSRPKTRPPCHN